MGGSGTPLRESKIADDKVRHDTACGKGVISAVSGDEQIVFVPVKGMQRLGAAPTI
jgi:hypothetical protein